ncbi:hypothetical protein P3488_10530 [Vibrio parahaemolyticus]|nr:hypothetical protein [Vibrio parahaemolyticus]
MKVMETLNTIEQLAQMYRSSIALEQNAAVKHELEKEALKAINAKTLRYLEHLEIEKPQQAATC